ncbi:hypothetical protein FRC19_001175 [Serendipita sp. 401]|nr:hypothetical protein FRC19_001175 [Serendipita sp. 401]KAG9020087.1 hypothetical protein FS842_007605 [Serendipita sp. 407]
MRIGRVEHLPNPFWIQLLYIVSFVIQTCDCMAFMTLKVFPILSRRSGNLTPFGVFALRAYACCLFPFKLLCFLLRGHSIGHTEVGQAVGTCFLLMHSATAAYYLYAAMTVGKGGFRVEPFTIIMLAHLGMVAWVLAAFYVEGQVGY